MATAVVRVRVGSAVVVHVEKPVIQVLVIVPANIKARVRSAEVPVIARMPHGTHRRPRYFLLTEGEDPLILPLKGVQGDDSRGPRPSW